MGPTNMASTLTLLRTSPICVTKLPRSAGCRKGHPRCARDFDVPYWTTDYRQLAARDDVDVVCVYSPDALHAEHCIVAIEHGKHVVCTKPMVTRQEDAQTLVRLVRQRNVKFLVGQTMRFDRQFLHANSCSTRVSSATLIALKSHYVHDMRPVYEFTPWRLTMPQDLMFGGCVHSIDILRAFGGDIRRVQAFGVKGNLTPAYPREDNFFMNLEFASERSAGWPASTGSSIRLCRCTSLAFSARKAASKQS